MKFKIEFPANSSKAFPAAIRACRTFKTYRVSKSFHQIEFSETEYKAGHAVFDIVRGFVGALFYKDDGLIRERDMNAELYELRALEAKKRRVVERKDLIKIALKDMQHERGLHGDDVEGN